MSAAKKRESRRPDYVLRIKAKHPEPGMGVMGRVGAGWDTESGGVTIQLDPGVVLDWRMNRDYYIALFPAEEVEKEQA